MLPGPRATRLPGHRAQTPGTERQTACGQTREPSRTRTKTLPGNMDAQVRAERSTRHDRILQAMCRGHQCLSGPLPVTRRTATNVAGLRSLLTKDWPHDRHRHDRSAFPGGTTRWLHVGIRQPIRVRSPRRRAAARHDRAVEVRLRTLCGAVLRYRLYRTGSPQQTDLVLSHPAVGKARRLLGTHPWCRTISIRPIRNCRWCSRRAACASSLNRESSVWNPAR